MSETIVINSKGYPSKRTVRKAVNDVLSLSYDFGLFFDTDTASTATVTADNGLTAGSPSVSSNVVSFTVSGGSDGAMYDLTVKLAGTTETKEVVTQIKVADYDYPATHDYWPLGHC